MHTHTHARTQAHDDRRYTYIASSISVKAISPAASPVSLLSKSVKLPGVILINDIRCAVPFLTGYEPFGGAHEQLVLHHCSHEVQYLAQMGWKMRTDRNRSL